jgi:glutathione S-transferase
VTAADVVTACVWRFAQFYRKETSIDPSRYPKLAAHSARAESLAEFASTPLD